MTTTIGILAPSFSPGCKATFDALGEALGVIFERRTLGDDRNLDGWIVLAADRTIVSEIERTTLPCYVVLDEGQLVSCGRSPKLTFTNRPEMAAVLRGRDVTADDAVGAKTLPLWLQHVVPLAFKEGAAVWAARPHGRGAHHYVALSPPVLSDGEALFTQFSGSRIACLLPLVLFVRSLSEDHSWASPPLQATFMFDDPNLHWRSYGFVDYREMVRHAAAADYHVSIATIPLDAWFVHPSTSAIFKENSDRISLLYHGNDHVFRELALSQSAEAMQHLLQQALSRIARMEARTGLDVAPVMAPPHGACRETALSEMARVGFEALCVSRGSLQHHNPGAAWTRTIGMKPCDNVVGLPIIPRFGLSENCRNDILIAALLRQPIVARTHHEAVAEGYSLLNETATFVNSLGEVAWRDMKTISRALYLQRQDGGTQCVRLLSKRVSVPIAEGTHQIQVERPWLEDPAEEKVFWRKVGENQAWQVAPHPEAIPIQVGGTIEIASGSTGATRTGVYGAGPRRLVPVARRLLTEGRDRALPSIRRIARRGR